MTNSELAIYKTIPCTDFNTYWVPFSWFTSLVREARGMKRIPDPHGAKLIMEVRFDLGFIFSNLKKKPSLFFLT